MKLGEMDIDQIQADGYEFGMDLAFGILEENEKIPARVLDIQKYVNRQYESCSKKKFMKVPGKPSFMNGEMMKVLLVICMLCNKVKEIIIWMK